MANCIFCFNKVGKFNSKKCKNGVICNSCLKSIPNCFPVQFYESDELQKIQRYSSSKDLSEFSQTAELGSLLIDEPHGLFAIESKQNVFRFTDLKEYDLHPTNIKTTTESVHCDIELNCHIKPIDVTFKKIIKKNVPCKNDRTSEKTMHFLYPNEISIINNIIKESIRKTSDSISRFITDYSKVSNEAKLIAESMLLVGDNYTLDEIKMQRNKLLGIYHPDNGGDAYYCERINASYKYLVEHYVAPKSTGNGILEETIKL